MLYYNIIIETVNHDENLWGREKSKNVSMEVLICSQSLCKYSTSISWHTIHLLKENYSLTFLLESSNSFMISKQICRTILILLNMKKHQY